MTTPWDDAIIQFPGYHFLQTGEWGEFKTRNGWKAEYLSIHEQEHKAACLILGRKQSLLSSHFSLEVKYCPRGPLVNWQDETAVGLVLNALQKKANDRGVIHIKIDPEIEEADASIGDGATVCLGDQIVSILSNRGWKYSSDQIQYQNTMKIDLSPDPDTLLMRMKQKTRYNIRLAEKKGVHVRLARDDELPTLFRMYAETSVRDQFAIRDGEYYLALWRKFILSQMAYPLIAYAESIPIAGLILFIVDRKAWYFFGMSSSLMREKMPTYLLQWEAMKLAKSKGCLTYDLWGAPDQVNEESPMWGVYRFKEGLGGQLTRWIGAWDYTSRPALYKLYTVVLPKIMAVLRRRGSTRTQKIIASS